MLLPVPSESRLNWYSLTDLRSRPPVVDFGTLQLPAVLGLSGGMYMLRVSDVITSDTSWLRQLSQDSKPVMPATTSPGIKV